MITSLLQDEVSAQENTSKKSKILEIYVRGTFNLNCFRNLHFQNNALSTKRKTLA